jgi:hypothetical protein
MTQIGYGPDDVITCPCTNIKIGDAATDKIGFFGATPVAKPSVTWPNTATATTTLNEAKANRLMVALVNLGLIVTT